MREEGRRGERERRWLKVISSEGEERGREEIEKAGGGMDENACPKYKQAWPWPCTGWWVERANLICWTW